MPIAVSVTLAEDSTGTVLTELLQQKDRLLSNTNNGFRFIMTTQNNQFQDANQGLVVIDCRVARRQDGSCALKAVYNYEHPPIFAARGTRGYEGYDYDANGNLIIWRNIEKYVLSSANRNDTLDKTRVYFVDPNGVIVKTGDNTQLHRFALGDSNNLYMVNQFMFAVGRGFGKDLLDVKSSQNLPSGLIKLTSEGSYGGSISGRWVLTMTPEPDTIIRTAQFTPIGAIAPTVEITTVGTIGEVPMKIARSGTLRYSERSEIAVEVTEILDMLSAQNLYDEIVSEFNKELTHGTSIIDLRGGNPVRSTVK
jgi:hypothetical protein